MILFSILTLLISVYFGVSIYRESIKGKTETITEYEEQLKAQGKVIITEKRLNEFKDYYEYFSDLDEIKDADAKKTLKTVRKSVERWRKEKESLKSL